MHEEHHHQLLLEGCMVLAEPNLLAVLHGRIALMCKIVQNISEMQWYAVEIFSC
jgi:hypothetical protein